MGSEFAKEDDILIKIVKEKFNLNPFDKYQAGYLVEKLFKKDRYSNITLTYRQILDKYYGNSKTYII